MLRAVVFDFDGVILESMDLKVRVFRDLFGAPPDAQERIARLYVAMGGMPIAVQLGRVYDEILGRPLSDADGDRLDREFRRRVDEGIAQCPFVPGMPAFLERRAPEHELFVVSGVPEEDLRAQVRDRGLTHLFRDVRGAPVAKPAHLAELLAARDWARHEVVFVGDARYDWQAAAENGVAFIGRVPPGRPNPFPDGVVALVADMLELEARWPAILTRLAGHGPG